MFRGNHPTRVDEKSRLKIPADFKRIVDERYGAQFYITSRDGKRAEVYPLQVWQGIEEKLAAVPNSNPAKRKFLDRTNFYGQVAEMDSQGRVLLPQILRESARLDGDTVVLGMQDHLHVVNRTEFTQSMDLDPWTENDDTKISDLGV